MGRVNHHTTDGERQSTDQKQSTEAPTTGCPECQSDSLVATEDSTEIVCEECGLVHEETAIDHGPEWRAFDLSDYRSKARVGAPMTKTRHDDGLTTNIDWKDKDTHGRSLSAEKRNQMQRLRTWQERIRTKDARERNLRYALSEINRMASGLGVPESGREVAGVIYRKALDNDLIRGRSIEGVATSCLYAACRQSGFPRSLDEVTEVSRVDHIEISRTYRYVAEELTLEMEPVDPKQYVPRFASELDVSNDVRATATEIIDQTVEAGLLSGKSPTGFAAGALYTASLLCKDKRTQKAVADVAKVTTVTIRNRYHEQIEEFDHS